MADYLSELHKYESTLTRYNTIACERDLTVWEEKRGVVIENKVKDIAAILGFDVIFNSDPRGYAIRFILPSKKYNSWDGETWALNW